MFVCLAGMFGTTCYFATKHHVHSSQPQLEVKMMEDLHHGVVQASKQKQFDDLVVGHPDASGERFWSILFTTGVLDPSYMKLVSLRSPTDTKPDKAWITTGETLPANGCSYTSPRLGEFRRLLQPSDDGPWVLITFNSRNWNNYPDKGVMVVWSRQFPDRFVTWLTFEVASEQYGITAEEWADPAGKLFGKKPPFQHTYE
jgi:hypothetical protein